jgi:hypothetical protein
VSVVRAMSMERCLETDEATQTYIFEAIREADLTNRPGDAGDAESTGKTRESGDINYFLRTTARSSPALISLFVAMGIQQNTTATTSQDEPTLCPSYVVQPQINMRSLSDVSRLTKPNSDGETLLATCAGSTQKTLVMVDMVGTVYVTKPRDKVFMTKNAKNHPDYGALKPMLIVGVQDAGSQNGLCGAPTATSLTLGDVVGLWKILFSEDCMLTTPIEETLTSREEVLFRFNSLMVRFHRDYNGLTTLQDYEKLWSAPRVFVARPEHV